MSIALFKHLGASPAPIYLGEVCGALKTGLVDGQESPLILIDAAKLYEVQKYCSITSGSGCTSRSTTRRGSGSRATYKPSSTSTLPPVQSPSARMSVTWTGRR